MVLPRSILLFIAFVILAPPFATASVAAGPGLDRKIVVLTTTARPSISEKRAPWPHELVVTNRTPGTIVVKMAGKMTREATVPPGDTRTSELAAGEYRILVRYDRDDGGADFYRGGEVNIGETRTAITRVTLTFLRGGDANVLLSPITRDEFVLGPAISADVQNEIRRLESKSPVERAYAAMTLARMRSAAAPAATALLEVLRDDTALCCPGTTPAREALAALGQLGSPAVADLTTAARHGDLRIQAGAVETLGTIGPAASAAVAALNVIVAQAQPRSVELAAWYALARITDDLARWVPKLVEALKKGERDAARLLGLIGTPAVPYALAPLTDGARGRDAWLSEESVRALGRMGVDAVPVVLESLRSPHHGTRSAATAAIQVMDFDLRAEHAPLLQQALLDPDHRTRHEVAGRLPPEARLAPIAGLLVPALVRALHASDRQLREDAAFALGVMKANALTAIPELIALLRRDRSSDAGWALSQISGLHHLRSGTDADAWERALRDRGLL